MSNPIGGLVEAADRIIMIRGVARMKARPWFNRFLSTYLPIFYLAVILLLFIFFMMITQMMNMDMSRTSENYAKYVLQTVESSLKNIDNLIYIEMNNNEDIQRYLYKDNIEEGSNEYLLNSRLSKKFNSILLNNTLIDSIYFYRASDQKVLSTSAVFTLESFGDRLFVEELLSGTGEPPHTWTGIRSFKQFESQAQTYEVVSMVKKAPLLSSARGYLVVNVSVKELTKLINAMNSQNISYTSVHDQNGTAIAASSGTSNESLSSIKSDYLSWDIRHSINANYNYSLLKDFYYGWIIVGALAIVLATLIIIYFARRYTSPIDNVINNITQFSKMRSQEVPDILSGQPRYIDKAVDHLLELAQQYSDVHQENFLHRRKQFFVELVGGERFVELPASEEDMRAFGIMVSFQNIYIGIVEIDKYGAFCEAYRSRDQYLIKYVISNAMKEIALQRGVQLWSEWLDNGRLTALFQFELDVADTNVMVQDICDQTRKWLEDNLAYSVSIGIGMPVSDLTGVSRSFEEAEEALAYSVGGNRVIPYWELVKNLQTETFEHLQIIRHIAESFKHRNKAWEESFDQLVNAFQSKLYLRQDVVNLLHYMIFHISREMSELPAAYTKLWDKAMIALTDSLKTFDSIDELRDRFAACLRNTVDQMEKLRVGRNNQELAEQAKMYMERSYQNPDLSLALLSERFKVHQSYISRLFKEQFGENFVDYLARIRIAQAKQLLQLTDKSIQDIASEVGYLHYFSFNRLFKRIVGVTPGEYRKQSASEEGENFTVNS